MLANSDHSGDSPLDANQLDVGCSKEPSFEYPQHMFWLRNKKNNFQLHTLIGDLDIIARIWNWE